jgi:hypothetical protein
MATKEDEMQRRIIKGKPATLLTVPERRALDKAREIGECLLLVGDQTGKALQDAVDAILGPKQIEESEDECGGES